MDELLGRVDALGEIYAQEGRLDALREKAEKDLGVVLGVRARVEIAAAGTIPRTDFKARRVIDDRDLFRDFKGKNKKD